MAEDKTDLTAELQDFLSKYTQHGTAPDPDELSRLEDACISGDNVAFAKAFLQITMSDDEMPPDRSPPVPNTYLMSCKHMRDDTKNNISGTFVGRLIVKNFLDGETVPNHVPIKNKQALREIFESVTKNADGKTYDPGAFVSFENQTVLAEIHQRCAALDWDKATVNCIAVLPMADGSAYSPAWNACWLVFPPATPGTQPADTVLWLMQAADAAGAPRCMFPGLALNKFYVARAGAQFTPLGRPDNYYGYELSTTRAGVPSQLTVKVFFAAGGEPREKELNADIGESGLAEQYMQLQISCAMKPATQNDLESRNSSILPNSVNAKMQEMAGTLVKGGLMFDIMRQYEPGKNLGKIFNLVNLDPDGSSSIFSTAGIQARAQGRVLQMLADNRAGFWLVPPGPADANTRQRQRDILAKIGSGE